jgi:hypothetical protein
MAEEAPFLRRLGRPGDVVAFDISLVDRREAGQRPPRLFMSREILFDVTPALIGRVQIDVGPVVN